jgi:hypothetical protein
MKTLYELLKDLYPNDTVTGFPDFCWVGLTDKTLTFYPDKMGIMLAYHTGEKKETKFTWEIIDNKLNVKVSANKQRWVYTFPQRNGYNFCSRTYFDFEEIKKITAKEEIRIGKKITIVEQDDSEPTY